jgi:N-methylhydantoinase A/oxoprolinase/acetone carboxylase beta subunit
MGAISQKLIEAGLNDAGQMNEANAGKVANLLTAMALHAGAGLGAGEAGAGEAGHGGAPSVFSLRFAPELPLVAVGAPAHSYYPAVARGLGMALELPQHAEVANAVGAVLGQVSQRVHVTVSQPVRGVFRVFAGTGPRDFDALAPAIALAQQLASAEAQLRAIDAGAASATVVLSRWDNQVHNDIDGHMFFEARVTATASGPALTRTDIRQRAMVDGGLAQVA